MHHDEIDSDSDLVRCLLRAQQPQWADLPIEPVPSTGTDNARYRLGDDMVVRLPLRPSSVGQADKEHRWLPELAAHLSLDVPVSLARGEPAVLDLPYHQHTNAFMAAQARHKLGVVLDE